MSMDVKELLLVKEFKDISTDIDGLVRKTILEEGVTYSLDPPPILSAGILEASLQDLYGPSRTSGYFESSQRRYADWRYIRKVKKRRALPYEKLCTSLEFDQFTKPKTSGKGDGGLCVKCSCQALKPTTELNGFLRLKCEEKTKLQRGEVLVSPSESSDESDDSPGRHTGIIMPENKNSISPAHSDSPSSGHSEDGHFTSRGMLQGLSVSTSLCDPSVQQQYPTGGSSNTRMKAASRVTYTDSSSTILCSVSCTSDQSSHLSKVALSYYSQNTSSPKSPEDVARTSLKQRDTDSSSLKKYESLSSLQVTVISSPVSPESSGSTPSLAHSQDKSLTQDRNGFTTGSLPITEIGCIDKKEIEEIIRTLVEAQTVYCLFETTDNVKEESKAATDTLSANVPSDSHDFKEKVMDSFVKYFERKIVETVRFAKRIPGFVSLPRDDQANLIKVSRNESDLISGMKSYNEKTQSFISMEGMTFTLEDLQTVLSEDTLNIVLEGAAKVSKLNASLEEAALLRAITITFSDRCELQCREKVEDIQNRLMSCLLHVVDKGSVPSGVRMGQLFDFLLLCRNVTEICLQNWKQILVQGNKYMNNPIIKEVL